MSSPAHAFRANTAIVICVLTLSLIVSPSIQAEEQAPTRTVITVGTSNVYRDDVSSARSLAIANGLVSAVAQAASDLVLLDSMAQDFQVISNVLFGRTNEFIQNYRVLNSAVFGKRYAAMMEATVSVRKMEEQLSRVGIMLLKNTLPKVLFFISEQDLSNPTPKYWWKEDTDSLAIYSESTMALAMQEKGFAIIDPSPLSQDPALRTLRFRPDLTPSEIVSLGARFRADLVILGTSIATEAANRMGHTRSYTGTLSARAFRTDSGLEVASTSQSFAAVSDSPSTGGADALAGAGRLAGTDFATQVATAWLKEIEGLGGIEVLIKWSGSLAELVELRTAIAGIPGFKRLLPRKMSTEEVLMTVDFEGTEKALADSLMMKTYSSFGIHVYEMAENHLGIEITH